MYYPNDEKFTRLVEYKNLQNINWFIIGMEIPSTNGMHYPVPFKKEIKKSHKYLNHYPNGTLLLGELEHIDMKLI